MDALRAVWVIHYPEFGGPHNRAARGHHYLAEHGIDLSVVLPDEPGSAAGRLREAGVPVRTMPLVRLRLSADPRLHLHWLRQFRADVARLRAHLRAERADAIILGGLVNVQGAIAARLEKVGVVWQVIDTRIPVAGRAAFVPLLNAGADVVAFGGRQLIAAHPGARMLSNATVCPPGVPTDAFRPCEKRRVAARDALGIPRDALVVGTVSNLNPQKGVEYFIRAAGLVLERVPEAYFVIIGARYRTHQTYARRLEQERQALGANAHRIIFAGPRADVEAWYPAFDVKVIASVPRSEGTTTTAMEALACEVPVVATDVGAVSEVVLDGQTGFLVEPCSAEALAMRIVECCVDPRLRRALGARGRELVVERFDCRVTSGYMADAIRMAADRAKRSSKSGA